MFSDQRGVALRVPGPEKDQPSREVRGCTILLRMPSASPPGGPPHRRYRHPPEPTRQRALEFLASADVEGVCEAVMLAQGFTIEQLVDLVGRGLATATPQTVVTGKGRYEIPLLRITPGGQKVLAK